MAKNGGKVHCKHASTYPNMECLALSVKNDSGTGQTGSIHIKGMGQTGLSIRLRQVRYMAKVTKANDSRPGRQEATSCTCTPFTLLQYPVQNTTKLPW